MAPTLASRSSSAPGPNSTPTARASAWTTAPSSSASPPPSASAKSAFFSHHLANERLRSTGAAVMRTAVSSGFTDWSSSWRSSTRLRVVSALPVTVSARKLTSFSHTTRLPPNIGSVCTASRNRFTADSTSSTLAAKPFTISCENSSTVSPEISANRFVPMRPTRKSSWPQMKEKLRVAAAGMRGQFGSGFSGGST